MTKTTNTEGSTDIVVDQLTVKQLIEMFDIISDILFWVKDTNGHIVYGNTYFLEHIGVSTLAHAIGRSDLDFSPAHLAKQFMVDDHKVMAGELVINRLEMNKVQSGELSWFLTTKRPLFDESGHTIGSYGISRHLEKTSLALSGMAALKAPVDYIQKNYMHNITLHDIAEVAHLSISALERRFSNHLSKTPKQFVTEVRLENARRLLVETNSSIATVGYDCGFMDHSYFSRQFKRLFGQLPSAFRKEHCK